MAHDKDPIIRNARNQIARLERSKVGQSKTVIALVDSQIKGRLDKIDRREESLDKKDRRQGK